MVEMQEVAHIVGTATDNSLVLIDELGRATSTTDGVAIAWAICEHLLAARVFTLFATHFRLLAELANTYPGCRLWQLGVDVSRDRLDFTWLLQPPPLEQEALHYGIMLARPMGFPEPLLAAATEVAERVQAEEAARLGRQGTRDAGLLGQPAGGDHGGGDVSGLPGHGAASSGAGSTAHAPAGDGGGGDGALAARRQPWVWMRVYGLFAKLRALAERWREEPEAVPPRVLAQYLAELKKEASQLELPGV